MTEKNNIQCSFCARIVEDDDEIMLIKGLSDCYICTECIKKSVDLIEETLGEELEEEQIKEVKEFVRENGKISSTSDIMEFLDKYIIGQSKAKKVLSVAVYNHYKALKYKEQQLDDEDVELEKSNILLMGPTGTGKTATLKTLARILDVPFAIADATTLTEAGYVGADVETIILKLVQAADGDIEAAERGILFIDEVDKIARKGENPSITKDVGSEGVQQAILKIIEGTEVDVPPKGGRKHPGQECIKVDTNNILFVLGGAFEGIDKIISQRLKKKNKTSNIGFGADVKKDDKKEINELVSQVATDDFKKYGIIPELLGRVPVICTFNELTEEEMVRILTEPKNAIVKQYKKLFELDGVKLEFEKEALLAIANKSIDRGTGARGLRGLIEEILLHSMHEISSDKTITKVTVTEECVIKGEEPVLSREKAV